MASDTYDFSTDTLADFLISTGAWEIDSGGARADFPFSEVNLARINTTVNTYTAVQEATATIGSIGNHDQVGPAVLLDASGNGYAAIADTDQLRLIRYDAGVLTALQSVGSLTNAADDTIRLTVDASGNLRVYYNDVLQTALNDTDTTYTSGQPGMAYQWGNNRGSRISDLTATDEGGSSTPKRLVGSPLTNSFLTDTPLVA